MEQLGPEKALALLNAGNGQAPGAVDVLSAPDDTKPSN